MPHNWFWTIRVSRYNGLIFVHLRDCGRLRSIVSAEKHLFDLGWIHLGAKIWQLKKRDDLYKAEIVMGYTTCNIRNLPKS